MPNVGTFCESFINLSRGVTLLRVDKQRGLGLKQGRTRKVRYIGPDLSHDPT